MSSATEVILEAPATVLRPTAPVSVARLPDDVSNKRRVAVAMFVLLGNMVQMTSNGSTFAAGVEIAKDLGHRDSALVNWAAASYPLTLGTFILVTGQLGSVYGHKNMLLLGGAWFVLWSFVNIGCRSFLSFNIVRGLTGIGGALILPNSVAIIGVTFPPGKMRNFCIGIFGAAAPIGGYLGAVLAGIFTQFTHWWGLFLFLGLCGLAAFTTLWYILPQDRISDPGGKIDWIGAAMGTSALVLFNFTWNQAPAAGWSNPYQIGILVGSVVLFTIFVLWERRHPTPIMPLAIWKTPSMVPLVGAVLMANMSFGILLWYMATWIQVAWGWTVLRFALAWTPFLFFGTFAAWWASWLVPRLPAQYILAIGLIAVAVSNLLLATMPVKQIYWAQVFPAAILMSFCPDLVFTAAQIIASNSVGRRHQGVAASLVGVLSLYGNALGLGFAGTIETEVVKVADTITGYRAALWFACGIAILALILDLCFVRIHKDEREGWEAAEDIEEETRGTSTAVAL